MNEKQLTPWQSAISKAKPRFVEISSAERTGVSYQVESVFALQAVANNELLAECSPQSLMHAVINVASVGLTLNPAYQYAYIVPRKGKACLDISYKGLIKLAADSKNIKWAKAVLVHESDKFEMQGIEHPPIHSYNPFDKDRGEVVGGYCVAKLADDGYMIDVMSRDELDKVRATSKASNGPWKTWEHEMMKKTLIKRASKTWPNTTLLDTAISIINEHEGLDDGYVVGRISGERIKMSDVEDSIEEIKEIIDRDTIEDTHDAVKDIWNGLSNDMRMLVTDGLSDKAKDSKRMYKTILKDYLGYVGTTIEGELEGVIQ